MPAPEDVLQPGLRGTVRVLGGPGTGKSTLLVEAAAAHIAAGLPPQSVLLLTGSGRLAAAARGALTARLLSACPPVPVRPGRGRSRWCGSRWSARCTAMRSRC